MAARDSRIYGQLSVEEQNLHHAHERSRLVLLVSMEYRLEKLFIRLGLPFQNITLDFFGEDPQSLVR